MDKRLQKRIDKAREFPTNTCAASRHAQMLGEQLVKGCRIADDQEDSAHCGESILSTVAALYETRTERDRLRTVMQQVLADAQAQDVLFEWWPMMEAALKTPNV